MFGKRKCSHCDRKMEKDFDFCPYCSSPLKDKKGDYGLLGENDDISEVNSMIQRDMNKIMGGSFMEKIMSNAIKMIEKELQKEPIQQNQARKNNIPQNLPANFELFINGKKVNLPGNVSGIQIEEMPRNKMTSQKIPQKAKIPIVSEETMQKSAKLPRKEAKSHVTRTSDKVIYELETPGLSSLNNVLVNKLESSIEIKAYTENAVYFKTISIKLPLMQYSLKAGKLVLEFKA
jgi:hypothetical protein